ncbi:MAG TPA: hypothetical protein PKL45_10440, partial [Bacteroidia bacterium]|nr:hypothetical protein [Bacteroidia bacterium]
REAEEKARLAQIEKEKQDSIAKAKADEEARLKREAEEKARLAQIEKEKQDSIAKAKADEEARLKREAEEKARLAAEEKAIQDSLKAAADAKSKADAEAKVLALAQAKEKAIADAAEKKRLEEEAAIKKQKEIDAQKEAAARAAAVKAAKERQQASLPTFEDKNYPEGITEETITENNRTIYRTILKKTTSSEVFSKVVYSWGGVFYFKNTTSVSEANFNQELKKNKTLLENK